jgi:hypothetical protein
LARAPENGFSIVEELLDVFKIRMKEVENLPSFGEFMRSILGNFMEIIENSQNDESFIFCSLQIAEAIMTDVIIPNNIQLEVSQEDALLSSIEDLNRKLHDASSSEQVQDCEMAEIISKILESDRSQIPVYAYESLGKLFVYISDNAALYYDSFKSLAVFYPWLREYSFEIKSAFIKPIGYQLLYLYQMFQAGVKRADLLTESVLIKLMFDYRDNSEGLIALLAEVFST